jgi:ribosomal protein L11 methyltransferase
MNTVELQCIIHADSYEKRNIADILIAQLAELGYHGFQDTAQGLLAYIDENQFNFEEIRNLPLRHIYPGQMEFYHSIIQEKNWNEAWEKGFKPVNLGKDLLIRAPFHKKDSDYTYEIVIEPKMSFGTGHHSTTYLMLEWVLELDLNGKSVLDMGCGTGILSILASKKGASDVWAVDTNEWAYTNTRENTRLNNTPNIHIIKGNSKKIKKHTFDVVLANINLNVLLEDIPTYAALLNQEGTLIVSGIYRSDMKKIQSVGEENKLGYVRHKERNLWVAMYFKKQDIPDS